MIKLFVIDDQWIVADGLTASFRDDEDTFRFTGKASDVRRSIDQINQHKVDIILLDLFIPREEPVQNIRKLKKEFPTIPVIIISVDNSIENQVMMFREGARGYFLKSDDKNELKNIILQVSTGNVVIPNEVMHVLFPSTSTHLLTDLNPDEIKIMHFLSTGFSIRQIAEKVFKSKSAVEKILSGIRHRLNVKSNCELLVLLLKFKSF